MAARTVKIRHDEETRAKIQVSQIVNRLTRHILGEEKMDASQVTAALGLLDRRLPKLAAVEHSGELKRTVVVRAPEIAASSEAWAKTFAPNTSSVEQECSVPEQVKH
jgi:hypothetical protein